MHEEYPSYIQSGRGLPRRHVAPSGRAPCWPMTSKLASGSGRERIRDAKKAEDVPAARSWQGLVFVGNAGGDFKGAKGHMYALDAKTGKIVWQFFLVPKTEGDTVRGPLAARRFDLEEACLALRSAAGELGLLRPWTRLWACYCPLAIPGLTTATGRAPGMPWPVPSLSSTPCQRHTCGQGLARLGRLQPASSDQDEGGQEAHGGDAKDGHLYGFDLADNKLLYRTPVTRIENVKALRCRQGRPFLSPPRAAGNGTARPTTL